MPFQAWETTLGGVVLGGVAGLLIWASDKVKSPPNPPKVEQNDFDPEFDQTKSPSRWYGLAFLIAGLILMAGNHALVVLSGKKYFMMVQGGAFFASLGLAVLAFPELLIASKTGKKLPWWSHALGAILLLGGLVSGLYLWIRVY